MNKPSDRGVGQVGHIRADFSENTVTRARHARAHTRVTALSGGSALICPICPTWSGAAGLVRLLAEIFTADRPGGGHFDHWSISSEIWDHPELIDALAFLGVRRRTSGWNRGSLTKASDTRIERWLRSVEGRDFSELRLERDAFGWYRVVKARSAA